MQNMLYTDSQLSKAMAHITECLKTGPWGSMKEISTEMGRFDLFYGTSDPYNARYDYVELFLTLPTGWFCTMAGDHSVSVTLRAYRDSVS